MKKIKIVGALIFTLSLTLAALFNYSSKEATIHSNIIEAMNEQKDFTQEISKNIFYIYKNQNDSIQTLDLLIKKFLNNVKNREEDLKNSKKIIKLWNTFYLYVQQFRDQIKNKSIYSNIILEKSVKDIYNTNLELIVEFDYIIDKEQKEYSRKQNIYKAIQYLLFITLTLLLLYMFTQIKSVISFVQKFISTSKAVILSSSIRDLKPMEISDTTGDISEAKNNFNTLVKEINDSISNAANSLEYSSKSIGTLEQNIEDLIELIYAMSENTRNKELRKKEDAVIQSLEELSTASKKLEALKDDLKSLITYSKETKLKNNN